MKGVGARTRGHMRHLLACAAVCAAGGAISAAALRLMLGSSPFGSDILGAPEFGGLLLPLGEGLAYVPDVIVYYVLHSCFPCTAIAVGLYCELCRILMARRALAGVILLPAMLETLAAWHGYEHTWLSFQVEWLQAVWSGDVTRPPAFAIQVGYHYLASALLSGLAVYAFARSALESASEPPAGTKAGSSRGRAP